MDDEVFYARDRRSVRRAVATECRVVTEWGYKPLGEQTRDLSADGMLLASEARAWVGEPVLISLRLPNSGVWLDTHGVVARVVEEKPEIQQPRGLGLRFLGFGTAARALVEASLEGFPPPTPQRQPRRDYAGTVGAIARH